MSQNTYNRSFHRYEAVLKAQQRSPRSLLTSDKDRPLRYEISKVFATNSLSAKDLKTSLSDDEYMSLTEAVPAKRLLSRELANKVARVAKDWAVAKGATHYCHWFQPLTGQTAEKHDSFFDFDGEGLPIQAFSGKALMQQEPDASSFPSGGRRSTFEARGYTAWDSSSPMFLVESENGATLCVPSVYVSYSGETLDMKTPLLRSIDVISRVATETLHLLGDKEVRHVVAQCGPEQEYFVVDRSLYYLRPDLLNTGRTMVGTGLTRGQQLEDHYFGAIKSRVLGYMMEVEYELYRLGVPCKTRHNEVAPSQFELAPIYEVANIAADHNQIVMETMRRVARKHDLMVLFHEKPYLSLNGSGKHLNWSLSDSLGRNLFDPGECPQENLRFLYFLTAFIKAVHDWGGLLRCSVASASNDYRLGANEAPPAIMSVFLGSTLSDILERIENDRGFDVRRDLEINLDLSRIPVISRDNTDRNRTSPLAFTGNKFEFRAVGASQSVSLPAAYLNAIVSDALLQMNAQLSTKDPKEILKVIKKTYSECKSVCFEGNNYSEEWQKEAERRGLKNFKLAPQAFSQLIDKSVQEMLLKSGVYRSKAEIDLRYVVQMDAYIKQRTIELKTMCELISSHILPAALCQLDHWTHLSERNLIASLKTRIEQLSRHTNALIEVENQINTLLRQCDKLGEEESAKELAQAGQECLTQAAHHAEAIEQSVDDLFWSLPKNSELIHIL